MIENIYSGDTTSSSHTGKSNTKIKTPKNVRQIGKIGEFFKIYVEDYVKTYTKQLAEGDFSERCIAILIGEYRIIDGVKDVFIYGAIGTSNAYKDENIEFTEGVWTNIYEIIKQYFPDGEIVGWYFGGASFGLEETKRLQQVHIDNFAGGDKVLLTYDILEREDNFYLYENGSMVLQPGYYIYYEKNEEMQNYMVEHKKVKQEELVVEDRAIKEIRSKLQDKQQPAINEKDQKTVLRLTYAAGTLIMVVALVVIVTIMNNSEKMKSLEQALNTISNRLTFQNNDNDNNENKSDNKENIFDINENESLPASNLNEDNKDKLSENQQDDTKQPGVTKGLDNTELNNDNDNNSKLNDNTNNTDSAGNIDSVDNTENANSKNDNENQSITSTPSSNTNNEVSKTPEKEVNSNTEKEATDTNKKEDETTNSDAPSNESKETSGIDASKLRKYTVKSGDTMASICMRLYGDYGNMQTIKELNQLVDENKIFEGQVLLIP